MTSTVLVAEFGNRCNNYNPAAAVAVAKIMNSATIFFRNKEMRIEYKIQFCHGRITDTRVKLGHKICTSEDIFDDIPEWDTFISTLGI